MAEIWFGRDLHPNFLKNYPTKYKMKNLIIIFILSFLMFTIGCEHQDGKLTLVNNSVDTIYYEVADSIIFYPIVEEKGEINYLFSNIIKPKEERNLLITDTWEYFINERCKDSTLTVFFFTNNLIRTVGKDSIMKYRLYSKRERLKVKDLEKSNWKVFYSEQ
ncbi:hypothetical protein SAMN04515674_108184 [Pseudarcicella hirudinis]|uniref:Uncharacterized protein n=1 Tax=Pseudarcicella hirudinis TaxID=1079859 RepID=A0A1I5V3N1_9BACT|nr:hypothetical protein [Pseudarcicella hirudinis]SFQ02113.1 hypothetical protein SAMN04515674_108184 [Pseudarcicella hirudinis]